MQEQVVTAGLLALAMGLVEVVKALVGRRASAPEPQAPAVPEDLVRHAEDTVELLREMREILGRIAERSERADERLAKLDEARVRDEERRAALRVTNGSNGR